VQNGKGSKGRQDARYAAKNESLNQASSFSKQGEHIDQAPLPVVDPLSTYKPPFKNKEKNKARELDQAASKTGEDETKAPRPVYSIELIFSLQPQNKQRPPNMAELDFPHKKRGTHVNGFRRKQPLSERDKFNKHVGEIRVLLNKLSASNFEVIADKLLNDFSYTPSLLKELMKMIFCKSTGEHFYLDVYVRLCALLFKRFKDSENYEMNFKKLLVNKCQKQFFQMLNEERQDRKKRRNSMNDAPDGANSDKPGQGASDEEKEDEFSKPMMYLYDVEELKERRKEQMYGNMYLITELYIAKQLNGNIIKTCLEDLQQEINNQNVEILSYMVTKLMNNCVKNLKHEAKTTQASPWPAKKGTKEITLEFVDKVGQHLTQLRHHKDLEARIKFKVQDMIDEYNKHWRFIVAEHKAKAMDTDGFKQIYVPKDQILTEQQVFRNGNSRFGKDKRSPRNSSGTKGYFYRAKSKDPR